MVNACNKILFVAVYDGIVIVLLQAVREETWMIYYHATINQQIPLFPICLEYLVFHFVASHKRRTSLAHARDVVVQGSGKATPRIYSYLYDNRYT